MLSEIAYLFLGTIIGAVSMFFGFRKYLTKNPPVNEKQIREMFKQMGRTPSEKQIKQIVESMKKTK
ncbi:Conserved hypothetical protein [Candidatus Phytoplasma mali]|uniref:YneF family protein n=1 Tax=Phytoplasma mali (strain AT) TaxID=482235 RepID=B3QZP2_PHYMT|nr:YneF family protein [Candidatus Phytoplasma mali]CAP18429.1 Conserved hypothetical protein [Candidatus Phytoplasma mali]